MAAVPPLIGWNSFNFSSETAEWNSTKHERKQYLNVLYRVFGPIGKNKTAALANPSKRWHIVLGCTIYGPLDIALFGVHSEHLFKTPSWQSLRKCRFLVFTNYFCQCDLDVNFNRAWPPPNYEWSFYFPHGKHICAILRHRWSTNSGDSYGHRLCSTHSGFVFILLWEGFYV